MIGVDMLHYAKITKDSAAEYTAETPKRVSGLTEAGFNVNGQSATFYADNGPYETAAGLGEFSAAIACADVTPEMSADIYGYDYNAETGELSVDKLDPPYIAIQYRIQKSNGAYRYVTIYKARAIPNEEKYTTSGGAINFATNGFSLKGAKRMKDGRIYRILDDDDQNLPVGVTPELIAAKWFTSVDWVIAAGE